MRAKERKKAAQQLAWDAQDLAREVHWDRSVNEQHELAAGIALDAALLLDLQRQAGGAL